jgi:hypothetical protein
MLDGVPKIVKIGVVALVVLAVLLTLAVHTDSTGLIPLYNN